MSAIVEFLFHWTVQAGIISLSVTTPRSSADISLGWLFFFFVFGFIPATGVHAWIQKAWPDVDLDFGPEHLNIARKRRGQVKWVLSALVVPVLVRLVIEVLS